MEQPTEDADELYDRNLKPVLNFFASKLQLCYSSSRLTLLLTLLLTSSPDYLRAYIIPLPSGLKRADDKGLRLCTLHSPPFSDGFRRTFTGPSQFQQTQRTVRQTSNGFRRT